MQLVSGAAACSDLPASTLSRDHFVPRRLKLQVACLITPWEAQEIWDEKVRFWEHLSIWEPEMTDLVLIEPALPPICPDQLGTGATPTNKTPISAPSIASSAEIAERPAPAVSQPSHAVPTFCRMLFECTDSSSIPCLVRKAVE